MRKTGQTCENVSIAQFVWTFALLNVFALLALGVVLYQSHIRTEAATVTSSQNIARLLDDSITASASRIDATLQLVVYELERQLRNNESLNGNEVALLLKATQPVLGELSQVRISNANGQVIYGEDVRPNVYWSWGDRDFFISQRDQPDKGLIISNPFWDTVLEQWAISFSRRYDHPDGSFAGVVSSEVLISYFGKLLSNTEVGPQGIVLLRDADFGMIVRHPPLDAAPGRVGAKGFSAELQAIIDSGRSVVSYHTKASSDGIERTYTYRRLTALPFHLLAGLATADYMKPWVVEFKNSLIKLFVFMLLTAILLYLLYHRTAALMQATELSLHDLLTGLFNRRAFDIEYDRLKRECARNHCAISVLFIDIDHFKKFNDTYGHDIGDAVLKRVAGAIENCLHRPLDMVCRWGGEEFAAVLPGTALEEAELLADNILRAVRQIEMPIGLERPRYSVSIGIASMKLTTDSVFSDLIDMADHAMLAAKQQGRDRYVVFDANVSDNGMTAQNPI